jgi:hypothetical protein
MTHIDAVIEAVAEALRLTIKADQAMRLAESMIAQFPLTPEEMEEAKAKAAA